jgi:hypothetical protein
LQEQLKQATESLQMVSKRLEDQGQTVDKVNSLINQNRGLNRALLELYNEAMVKLSQADQVIKAQGAEYANVMQDAQTMAQMMAEDEQANTQSAELDAQALNAMLGQ